MELEINGETKMVSSMSLGNSVFVCSVNKRMESRFMDVKSAVNQMNFEP